MKTLDQAGLEKVLRGETSLEEMYRVTLTDWEFKAAPRLQAAVGNS